MAPVNKETLRKSVLALLSKQLAREVRLVITLLAPVLGAGFFLFLGIIGKLPGTRPPAPPPTGS